MPPYQAPLHLPSYDLRQLFSADFDYDDCYKLWSMYGMLSDSASESWTCRLLYKGDIVATETIAKEALSNAYVDYPDLFVKNYMDLVTNSGQFLERFVDDINNENWDPTSGIKTVRDHVFASFLLLEAQLSVRSFSFLLFNCLYIY